MAKNRTKKAKTEHAKSPPGFDQKFWHGIAVYACDCGFDAMSLPEAERHYAANHKPRAVTKVSDILDENGNPIVTKS